MRKARYRDPQSAPDFRERNRFAPRRRTPSRRPHGSMNFRSLNAVNGARFARRLRRSKTIDSVQTSEKRGFHEIDGAPRRNAACGAEPPSWKSPARREGGESAAATGQGELGNSNSVNVAPLAAVAARGDVMGQLWNDETADGRHGRTSGERRAEPRWNGELCRRHRNSVTPLSGRTWIFTLTSLGAAKVELWSSNREARPRFRNGA